jgi:3-oxoacyl-[acyl-carrier protein] reductase
MNLEDRSVLVLGAVKGVGKAIALALAGAGARVSAVWCDWEEALPELERDLAASGAAYQVLRADLRDQAEARSVVAAAVARFGGLSVLIANIERGGWPVVHGPYTEAQWDLELATTLRAKHWVFNAALPSLKRSGDGAVINLSSIAGIVGRCGPAAPLFNDGYAAASRAVSALTETWARVGAPEVRVNELMLGLVETRHGPGTRGWGLLSAAEKRAIIDHTLLRRIGTCQEVAAAVMFMLRDASFMTGSVLRLDGGFVLGGEPVPPLPPGVV